MRRKTPTNELLSLTTLRAIAQFKHVLMLERKLEYAQRSLNRGALLVPISELEAYHEITSKLEI